MNSVSLICNLILITIIFGRECKEIIIRRNFLDLTSIEQKEYIEAIKRIKDTGLLDKFIKVHLFYGEHTHSKALFLFWHRAFIKNYEILLRRINPNLSLYYWDWSEDAEKPEKSEIFKPYYYGGNGNINDDNCIKDGLFKDWRFNIKEVSNCIRRNFSMGEKIKPFANYLEIMKLSESHEFSEFSDKLEIIHNYPHNNIGDNLGTIQSTTDPIFFLHHSFVDKIWYEWQSQKDNKYKVDGEAYEEHIGLETNLIGLNLKIKDTLNTEAYPYCYKYDNNKLNQFKELKVQDYNNENDMTKILNFLNITDPLPELSILDPKKLKTLQNFNSEKLKQYTINANKYREKINELLQ